MKSKTYINISNSRDEGSIEGYVVSSQEVNLENYLLGFNFSLDLINNIRKKYQTISVIRNLYVEDEYRNQGIGSELFEYAIECAAQNNAEIIIIVPDVIDGNSFNLVSWYKDNYDFEIVEYNDNGNGVYPVMIKNLKI